MIIHTVKKGESLTQIAKEYNVALDNLAADNGLSDKSPLAVGQAIVIQIPTITHTVKRGDTVYSVAKEYSVSPIQIMRNNFKLFGSTDLTVGSILNINYEGEKTKSFCVNSYAYTNIDHTLLRSQMPYLSYFTPFTYGISTNGSLILPDDTQIISIANEYGVRNLLHLSTLTENGNFSSERASLLFQNNDISQNISDEVLDVIKEKGLSGADVDFEFINPEERYDYIQFLQNLRLKLNPLGLELFSALAPKISDTQQGQLYEGHDYAGIAAAVNYVLLMTYEWGYTYGPPMAVAPINKVLDVIRYARTRMSSDKIFMGIPTYGYDWLLPYEKGNPGAPSVSPLRAVELAATYGADIMFDETAKSPWFRYADEDGRLHEVWFEDARSIDAKLKLAANNNLFGLGYWNAMREFPQNWIVLNANYNIINYQNNIF